MNEDTHYCKHKVVGDSPEFEDERRFKMGTPSEVWHTWCRCWEIEPSSARIRYFQFIWHFGKVLSMQKDVWFKTLHCALDDDTGGQIILAIANPSQERVAPKIH
jgi:hypothetical protein